MFERFDADSRQVVISARAQAERLKQGPVGTHHLLLALLEIPGQVARSLEARGVTRPVVEAGITALIDDHRPPTTEDDRQTLDTIGIDLDQVRASAESAFGPGALDRARDRPKLRRLDRVAARVSRGQKGRRPLTEQLRSPFGPRARKVLELALREAIRLKARPITPAHIGLGLLREGEGLACAILVREGVPFDDLRRAWETPNSTAA